MRHILCCFNETCNSKLISLTFPHFLEDVQLHYKRCASSETRLRGAELNRPADVLFVLLSADNDSQVEAAAASSEKYPTITPTCCSHDSAYDLMIRHPAEQQELSVK